MTRWIKRLLIFTLFIGVIGLSTVYYFDDAFDRPAQFQTDGVIEVPRGANMRQMARILDERGFIEDELVFLALVYYEQKMNALKFGEYALPAGSSMREILDIITEGQAIALNVTFPEGWTSFQIVERLNETEGLTGQITERPSEGSLAPNTYQYLRDEERQAVLQRMQEAQAQNLKQAWDNRDPDLPLSSPEELLILASIVEKETGHADERPIVASVFVNRLRKNMPLQTDPTVIYGITKGEYVLGRGLRRSELDAETPYNTYKIQGLPPTPIANPSMAALLATANPADTDFIYFVAKTHNPRDGHNFSRTLDEHNQFVRQYRAAVRAAEANE